MINATLDDLIINEDELFNRVLALGPGDGINRPAVMVEDAVSISKYGVRETQIDVPDAADFTELEGRANSFLDAHKEPVTEISITFFYDTSKGPGGQIYEGTALTHDGQEIQYYRFGNNREIKRGDTIRIVIRSLEINTTGVIEELDWEPGSVSMSIGTKRYNLLEVVDGARLAAERGEAALGVPKPISLRASTGNPGCVVQVNPYTSTRAVGIEVYGSTSSTFASSGTPPRDTLLYRGTGSRIELRQLVPGSTYYFVVRAFDASGRYSAFTSQVSAVAGFIVTGLIGPGQVQQGNIGAGAVTEGKIAVDAVTSGNIQSGAITASKIFVDDQIVISAPAQSAGALTVRNNAGAEVLRLGNITNKTGVPSGSQFGLWGELGTGVYIRGAPRVVGYGVIDIALVLPTFLSIPAATYNAGDTISYAGGGLTLYSGLSVPSGQKAIVTILLLDLNFSAASKFVAQTFAPQITEGNGGIINGPYSGNVSGGLFGTIISTATHTVASTYYLRPKFLYQIIVADA